MSSSDSTDKPKSVLAVLASAAAFFADSLGVSLRQISDVAGIDPVALMDPNARIPERAFLEILRLLDRVRPKRNISLELASTLPTTFLGAPWRLFGKAPNLRTALELIVQHSGMFVDSLELEVIPADAETALRCHHPFDDIDDGLGGEFILAFAARVVRDDFGEDIIHRVQLRNSARSPLAVYDGFFGVPVTFEADFNALVFLSDSLERSNPKALSQMHGSLSRRLSRLSREMGVGESNGLANVHRAIAMNAMNGDFSVSGLAARMAMSTRKLQRRLRASGHRARHLLDEARHARAIDLLDDERVSIEGIASRLGFSSERSFRRAFLHWTGKSPAQARREMGEG